MNIKLSNLFKYVFIFASPLLFSIGIGCGSNKSVVLISSSYGLIKNGGEVPHSSYTVSLVKKGNRGQWIVLWHAISFRCEEPTAFGDAVIFGGVTQGIQADQGQVRLLYHSDSTGIVDITEAVARRAGFTNSIFVSFIDIEREDSEVDIKMHGQDNINLRLSIPELQAVVQVVVDKNRRRKVDGINLFE